MPSARGHRRRATLGSPSLALARVSRTSTTARVSLLGEVLPKQCRAHPSLHMEARRLLHLCNGRGVPLPGERLALGCIEAHGQVERSLGGGKPVGLLVPARTLV